MNVSLTPELEAYINAKVESGLYASASEVVREALRLHQGHDPVTGLPVSQIQEMIQKGLEDLEAGRVTSGTMDEHIERMRQRLESRRIEREQAS